MACDVLYKIMQILWNTALLGINQYGGQDGRHLEFK